jgi:hypothetical protein
VTAFASIRAREVRFWPGADVVGFEVGVADDRSGPPVAL